MGVTTGLSAYECDRCGKKEYLTSDAPNLAYWHKLQRVTADGVTFGYLLCEGCHSEHLQMQRKHDQEFNAFMAGLSKKE